MMKSRTMWIALVALMSLASLAGAQDTLWDQTDDYTTWSMGFFNMIAGAAPFGATQYTVNDIVVPTGGWTINTMRVYFDGFDFSWDGTITQAVLYIEPKTGSLPIGDPGTGTTVAASCGYLENGFMEVTATGLDTFLDEGEYWIGLTPYAPSTGNIMVSVAAVGDSSPTYDAYGFPMPMWANWAPGLDGAILIEGVAPVGTDEMSLDQVKSLFR